MAGTRKKVAQSEVGGLGKILVIQDLVNHVMTFEIQWNVSRSFKQINIKSLHFKKVPGNIHVSMLFSQIIPPSSSPTESKSLLFTSVSLLLSCIQGHHYHLYKFHIKKRNHKKFSGFVAGK